MAVSVTLGYWLAAAKRVRRSAPPMPTRLDAEVRSLGGVAGLESVGVAAAAAPQRDAEAVRPAGHVRGTHPLSAASSGSVRWWSTYSRWSQSRSTASRMGSRCGVAAGCRGDGPVRRRSGGWCHSVRRSAATAAVALGRGRAIRWRRAVRPALRAPGPGGRWGRAGRAGRDAR